MCHDCGHRSQNRLRVQVAFRPRADELDTESLPSALQTPEIKRALEELLVLSHTDLERERYLARVKVQRDELSRIHFAKKEGREEGHKEGHKEGREQGREEGRLMGAIQTFQEFLGQPVTPVEELQQQSLEELQKWSERLKQELAK